MASNEKSALYLTDGPVGEVGQGGPAHVGNLSLEALDKDMSSSVSAFQTVTTLLADTDRLSLAALQSKTFEDGHIALGTFDLSSDAIKALELALAQLSSTTHKLKDELSQRRARVVPIVNAVHNASQPVMRLPSDVLHIIVEILAYVWIPKKKDLGWIKTTHVCAVWRSAIVSLAPLWAREFGFFPSEDAIRAISLRARDAPVRFRNILSRHTGILSPHQWRALSRLHKMHTLDLRLSRKGVTRLVELLCNRSNDYLEIISVSARDNCSQDTYDVTNALPDLRCLSYEGLYILLRTPNLHTLSLLAQPERCMGDRHLVGLLDALKSCQSLVCLQLIGWASQHASQFTHQQRISLPRLEIFTAIGPRPGTQYTSVCQHLDLPVLKYLYVEVHADWTRALTSSTIFGWLLSHKNRPPCLGDANEFSIVHESVRGPKNKDVNNLQICLDDGSPESIAARALLLFFKHPVLSPVLDSKRGVHIIVNASEYGSDANVFDSGFISSTIASFLKLYGHSTVLPVVRDAHMDLNQAGVNWTTVLQPLADAEVLHVPYYDFRRLLPALSGTGASGMMLLPRLQTIVCEKADGLIELLQEEEREMAEGLDNFLLKEDASKIRAQIRDMLSVSARAASGVPVMNMRAVCKNSKQRSDNEGVVNAYFTSLVSLYL